MNTIRIVPGKTGSVVTAYPSNADFAYVQLEQSAIIQNGGWIREVKRTTLLRGNTSVLEKFVKSHKDLTLPGSLIVLEYLESQVPADIAKENLRNDVSFEDAIAPYIKRAGENGVALTYKGERILRFTKWDPTNSSTDIRVVHDNQVEIANAKQALGAAKLPGNKA
jgi:hypothetical protein